MSDMKVSERLRVALAVNGRLVLDRNTAIAVIRGIEALEGTDAKLDAKLAELRDLLRRMRRETLIQAGQLVLALMAVGFAIWAAQP